MPRVHPPSLDTMSAEQRRVHDLIASGPRGRVRGPLAVWLNRPAMAEPAQALGQYCRYDSSLSPRLSELGILCLAKWWGSEFEWWAHKPIALKAGVAPAVVDALRDGRPVPFVEQDEALVHEFLQTLHTERRINDELYARALAMFGQDAVIDLVALAGYYTLISMTLNVFEIDLPQGERRELTAVAPASNTLE